jgi:hypothetical protein
MLYFEWLQSHHYDSSDFPHPNYRQPSPPPPVWQQNLHPFGRELKHGLISIAMLKSKGKSCMVDEPSPVKQLFLNQVCKIGLKPLLTTHL